MAGGEDELLLLDACRGGHVAKAEEMLDAATDQLESYRHHKPAAPAAAPAPGEAAAKLRSALKKALIYCNYLQNLVLC